MSRPPIRDQEALLLSHGRRIKLLERRLAAHAGNYTPPFEPMYSGTTAERDAFFGSPANAAERVALANRGVVWFNTEKGWEESYYVQASESGLVLPGLATTATAGWYPTGRGPRARLVGNGSQSHSTGSFYTAWKTFTPGQSSGPNDSWRNDDSAFDYAPGGIGLELRLAGRYSFELDMTSAPGTGAGVMQLGAQTGGGIIITSWTRDKTVSLNSTLTVLASWSVRDVPCSASRFVYMKTQSASTWTVGGGGALLTAEYLGPALVSA